MSDKLLSFLGYFFAATIVIGALGLAYIADKYNQEPFFGNTAVKYTVITYCSVGVFFIVYSEVRKRVSANAILATLLVIIVIFSFLALTRL